MQNKISRKKFISDSSKVGFAACLGVGFSTLLQSCKTTERVQAPILNDVIRIQSSLLDKNGSLIIENDQLEAPIYLHKTDKGVSALLLLCTHKNCEINPTGSLFTCPCHGSQFDKSGKRLSGPAVKNLTIFKTEQLDTSEIIIYLKQKVDS